MNEQGNVVPVSQHARTEGMMNTSPLLSIEDRERLLDRWTTIIYSEMKAATRVEHSASVFTARRVSVQSFV